MCTAVIHQSATICGPERHGANPEAGANPENGARAANPNESGTPDQAAERRTFNELLKKVQTKEELDASKELFSKVHSKTEFKIGAGSDQIIVYSD